MYLCITNRKLCKGDFLKRIEELAQNQEIEKIILREKDMEEASYEELALKCREVCRKYKKPLAVSHFWETAARLGISRIQVSMQVMEECQKELAVFGEVGVSVHSVEEAVRAEHLGAGYLIAGHVFPTDCKKGMPARGLDFLRQVCQACGIPVYGIGGVTEGNIGQVIAAGAAGGCVMSGFMLSQIGAGG